MQLEQEILSKVIIHNKYARFDYEKDRRETWDEIVDRNKAMHIEKFPNLKDEIEEAYEYVYDKKALPSMRSMQFAGKPIKISPNRIYNCAYLPVDSVECFSETMFLLLGGTGVGYSVQEHHVKELPEINKPTKTRRYLIGDSIEGWADAVRSLMRAYMDTDKKTIPDFDYSDIRPKGARLVTSGGKAPGPQPLHDCLHNIKKVLDSKERGSQLTPLEVHDIICYIADAVLAGGIRRAALISLFSFEDEEMRTCKSGSWWELNPQRGRANNSAVAVRSRITQKDFKELWDVVQNSNAGEPGIYFTNDKSYGTNPCCEISLRPYQFCNLCEINGSNIDTQEEFNNRARVASFIGTLQASYTNFHYLRDIWKDNTEKDALVGVGITGIGSGKLKNIDLEEGAYIVKEENARVASLIGINQAARTTTVKPSGTSSLVLGCSSGIHAWHNDYYIRRIQLQQTEALHKYLELTIPELLEDYYATSNTSVLEIPLQAPKNAHLRHESAMDLLDRVKRFNLEWVREGHRSGMNTNNVSATVSIRDDEWDSVCNWIWNNRHTFNGLSVLPYDNGSYKQAPFSDCTKEEFESKKEFLKEIEIENVKEVEDNTDLQGELACTADGCVVK